MQAGSLFETLRELKAGGCDFILVGGLAAVLNGAPIQTYDIDVVYARNPGNIERCLAVLASLDAVFRIQPERRLKPNASHLSGSGHLNLLTRAGPLDLLAAIGCNLSYDDLLPHSEEMKIGEGTRIQVLNLETIIGIKEQLAGEKDLATLPVLRQTLKEFQKTQKKRPDERVTRPS